MQIVEKELDQILEEYRERESYGHVSETTTSDLVEAIAEWLYVPIREARVILRSMINANDF